MVSKTGLLIELQMTKKKESAVSDWTKHVLLSMISHSDGFSPAEPSGCHFMRNAASDWLSLYSKWWVMTGLTFYSEQQALIGEGTDTGPDLISSRP